MFDLKKKLHNTGVAHYIFSHKTKNEFETHRGFLKLLE